MIAIEFETDSDNGVIRIPSEFDQFRNGHVKVIVMAEGAADNGIRQPGSAKDTFYMAPDFEKPLDDNQVSEIFG